MKILAKKINSLLVLIIIFSVQVLAKGSKVSAILKIKHDICKDGADKGDTGGNVWIDPNENKNWPS